MSRRHVKASPKEFREQVVKLALSSGRRPREIAEEFEISVDSVRRWVRQAQLDSGERKDGLAATHRRQQAVARASLVLVNHFHLEEPQFTRMVGEHVLHALPLEMVADQEVGGLAHVDEGLALQMLGAVQGSVLPFHVDLPGTGP